MNYDQLAHHVNALAKAGDMTEARDFAERSINLLFREEAKSTVEFRLCPMSEIGTVSSAHIRIAAQDTCRLILCPEEILLGTFTHRLDAFKLIAKLFSTQAMRHVRSGSVVFDIEDGSNLGTYPRVAFNSALPCATLVTNSYWHKYRGYESLRAEISKNWIDWQNRSNIVFWRGSPTGLRAGTPAKEQPITDWKWLQRLHLCDVAHRSAYASMIDVGVTNFTQIHEPHLQSAIAAAELVRPKVDKIQLMKYRYIIDIDGNACAWDGFYSALLMGACILKIESRFGWKEWYYGRLQPYSHFIPLKQDLSDLDAQISWAIGHEAECAAIATAAKSVVDTMGYEEEIEKSGTVIANQFSAVAS